MAGLGSSGGMLIGGLITTFLSWRFGFWINVPIAVVVLVLAVRFLPALPSRPGRFDFLGAVLLTGSMFLITLALVERSVLGLKDEKSWSEPDFSALWCGKVWFKVVGGQL